MSKPCVLVGLTTVCTGMLMVATGGDRSKWSCAALLIWVSARSCSCILVLFCTLEGIVIVCGDNGEGFVKESILIGGPETLVGAVEASVIAVAS